MSNENKKPTPRLMPKKHKPVWRSYQDQQGRVNGPMVHGSQLAYSTATTPAFKAPDEVQS